MPTGKYRFIPDGYDSWEPLDKGARVSEDSNPRDTQFSGAASLLFDEIWKDIDWLCVGSDTYKQKVKRLIARRFYDVSQHSVGYSLEYLHECGVELAGSGAMNTRIQPTIPDMTEFPEEAT